MTAYRLCLLSLLVIGAPLSAAITVQSASIAPWAQIKQVFSEGFDDELLGAVPDHSFGDPSAPLIQADAGFLVNASTHASSYIVVEAAGEGPAFAQVLRLSDAEIPFGAGHSQLEAYPGAVVDSDRVTIRFDLRPEEYAGESLMVSVIDNRTTPGTGRLVAFEVTSTGEMMVSGRSTGFRLEEGHTYRVRVGMKLSKVGGDWWSLRVGALDSRSQEFVTGWMPTEEDGSNFSKLVFSLSDAGRGSFELDNIRIEAR